MRKIFPLLTCDLPPIARVRLRKRTVACPAVNILCSCVGAGLEEFICCVVVLTLCWWQCQTGALTGRNI